MASTVNSKLIILLAGDTAAPIAEKMAGEQEVDESRWETVERMEPWQIDC